MIKHNLKVFILYSVNNTNGKGMKDIVTKVVMICCGVLESISQSSPLLLSDVSISRYTVSLVRIDKELGGFWSTISIAETIVPDIDR